MSWFDLPPRIKAIYGIDVRMKTIEIPSTAPKAVRTKCYSSDSMTNSSSNSSSSESDDHRSKSVAPDPGSTPFSNYRINFNSNLSAKRRLRIWNAARNHATSIICANNELSNIKNPSCSEGNPNLTEKSMNASMLKTASQCSIRVNLIKSLIRMKAALNANKRRMQAKKNDPRAIKDSGGSEKSTGRARWTKRSPNEKCESLKDDERIEIAAAGHIEYLDKLSLSIKNCYPIGLNVENNKSAPGTSKQTG